MADGATDNDAGSPTARADDPNFADAEKLKAEGNEFLKAEALDEADDKYSQALALREDATYYSNRSFVRNKLKKLDEALADANRAVEMAPRWYKAHSRKIAVLQRLKSYIGVLVACDEVCCLEDG
jgi:tetratricopeptide (TPR) repeat protein